MPLRQTRIITLASSAARTAAGTSEPYEVSDLLEAQLLISITAISGTDTPTITFTVQVTDDISGTPTYWTHTTGSGLTQTGQTRIALTNFGKYVRLSWAITGTTPSFTFDVVLVGKN